MTTKSDRVSADSRNHSSHLGTGKKRKSQREIVSHVKYRPGPGNSDFEAIERGPCLDRMEFDGGGAGGGGRGGGAPRGALRSKYGGRRGRGRGRGGRQPQHTEVYFDYDSCNPSKILIICQELLASLTNLPWSPSISFHVFPLTILILLCSIFICR